MNIKEDDSLQTGIPVKRSMLLERHENNRNKSGRKHKFGTRYQDINHSGPFSSSTSVNNGINQSMGDVRYPLYDTVTDDDSLSLMKLTEKSYQTNKQKW